MCLIAVAWQSHAEYPLVVAGNRDEFFARPTAAADWWTDRPMLAGRDLRAGGTWMGVSREGRFAALTNFRDPSAQRADAPSRGTLVGDFLGAGDTPEAALRIVANDAGRYNGFNLIAAQWHGAPRAIGLWVVSSDATSHPAKVAPGIHAVSNARLDTPWPKVRHAIDATHDALRVATSLNGLVDGLLTMLTDRSIADDAALPGTGIALDVERALSAPFIRMPGYGTRASTIFIVDRHGHATFVERRCEPDLPAEDRRYAFDPA